MCPDTIVRLRDLVIAAGHRPHFVDAEKKLPLNLPISVTDHVSTATFYRLYIASLLPHDLETVIHLDLDLVAVRSAHELFTAELEFPVAAVDHASPTDSRRVFGDTLGTYFQAGVLVIDLVQWRTKDVETRFRKILEHEGHRIRWWDQDVLNIAFQNDWQRLPIWFNVNSSQRKNITVSELTSSAILIHYDGSRKPWVRFSPQKYSDYWYTSFEQCFGYSLRKSLRRKMAYDRLKSQVLWPIRAGKSAFNAAVRMLPGKAARRGLPPVWHKN
jgi:lipopolysaccharide biosynthesis glycosyltransferase